MLRAVNVCSIRKGVEDLVADVPRGLRPDGVFDGFSPIFALECTMAQIVRQGLEKGGRLIILDKCA